MIYTHDFLMCPWCSEQSGCRVDHLYDEAPMSFGTWYCKECRMPFSGKVLAPHKVEVAKDEPRDRFSRSMALLKFDGKGGPVFFVMDHDRYRSGKTQSDEENQESQKYFFEEHSCPTNWLRECVAVIEDGDCDPHGFLEFVRCVDVPNDFDTDDDDNWPILFPEAFGAPIIDGNATEVRALMPPTSTKVG